MPRIIRRGRVDNSPGALANSPPHGRAKCRTQSIVAQEIAVFAGTFDPPTNGHLDIIRRVRRLFDELIVAVGRNPEKKRLLQASLSASPCCARSPRRWPTFASRPTPG
ncbi:MAG: adenylyltransferase/cytidyltransferase family protein [Phycisphaerae bacterium]